jgi:hypothetical protein
LEVAVARRNSAIAESDADAISNQRSQRGPGSVFMFAAKGRPDAIS